MNKAKIEEGVKLLLEGIGEDINREGLLQTPQRVAELYENIFSGINKDPKEIIKKNILTEELKEEEVVWIRDIEFYSICEHHLMPFFGKIDIGYLPTGNKIIGISKIINIVEILCKRLQLQERLTQQLANIIYENVEVAGVKVIIKAEHLCLYLRKNKHVEFLTTVNIGKPIS